MECGDGGQVKKLQILFQIFIISFAIENLITGISRGETIEYYLYFCLPFFIIPIMLFFFNKKIIFSVIFLLIASIVVVISEIGVFDGALLLIFALYLYKNQKFEIIALSIITIAISLNAFFNSFLPSQLFIMIRLYTFFYLIYYFTIRFDRKKAEESNIDYNLQGKIYLIPEEKELLKLMANGKNYKEIAQHFGRSQNTITNWKAVLLCKFQASSNEQLMFFFGKYSNIIGDTTDADK